MLEWFSLLRSTLKGHPCKHFIISPPWTLTWTFHLNKVECFSSNSSCSSMVKIWTFTPGSGEYLEEVPNVYLVEFLDYGSEVWSLISTNLNLLCPRMLVVMSELQILSSVVLEKSFSLKFSMQFFGYGEDHTKLNIRIFF